MHIFIKGERERRESKGGRDIKRHTERWRDREKEKRNSSVCFLRGALCMRSLSVSVANFEKSRL